MPKVDPKDKMKLISMAYSGFHRSKANADSNSACKARYVPPCMTTYPLSRPIMADRNTGGLHPTIVQYSNTIPQVILNSMRLLTENCCTMVEMIRKSKAICDPDTDKI